MRIFIKVCGMREEANIEALASLDIDYMGFIFYKASKRYIGEIPPKSLYRLKNIKKTGVFVNASLEEIVEKVEKFRLDAVQLHGAETPHICNSLKKHSIEVIKAFGIDRNFDPKILKSYEPVVDHFLFDTKSDAYGGTGTRFDWNLLKNYSFRKSYFLSGGLSRENLNELNKLSDPRCIGVDLNSKFELTAGLKDITLLENTIKNIRNEYI